MAAWIHLIFYSMITYISRVVHIFSELKKVENWRFYGRFSCVFCSVLNLRSVYWGSDLRDGCMDLSDILQHDNLYSWNCAKLFEIWKNWKSANLWLFCLSFLSILNLRSVYWGSDLRDACMDSFDILQHDNLYSWGGAKYFEV